MPLRRSLISLSALGVALTSCTGLQPDQAGSAAAPQSDCFSSSFISGYETVDDKTIRVRANVNDRYDILVSGGRCNMLEWSQRLAIETPATSQLCVGEQLGQGDIAFRDPTSRRRVTCHIDEVRRAPADQPKAK